MPYADQSYALPFTSGSETSREAAIKAADFVGQQGEVVYAWFADQIEGGTQREASEALQIGRPSICARTRALELAGRLVKTENRRQGCAVYIARSA